MEQEGRGIELETVSHMVYVSTADDADSYECFAVNFHGTDKMDAKLTFIGLNIIFLLL